MHPNAAERKVLSLITHIASICRHYIPKEKYNGIIISLQNLLMDRNDA